MIDSDQSFLYSDLNISFRRRTIQSYGKHYLQVNHAYFTIATTSLGLGMLLIPLAFAYSGVVQSLIALTCIAFLQYQANLSIMKVGYKIKAKSYPQLIQRLIRTKWLQKLILVIYFFNIFWTIVSYSVCIQKSLSLIFTYLGLYLNKEMPKLLTERYSYFWIISTNALLTPFIYFRRIKNYSVFTILGYLSALFVIVTIIVSTIFSKVKLDEINTPYNFKPTGIFRSLPLMIYAFLSYHQIIDIYREIQKSQMRKMNNVLRLHILCLFIFYCLIGYSCYSHFGEEIITFNQTNILLSYQFNDNPILLVNFLVVFLLIVNIILNFKPCKEIFTLIFRNNHRESWPWNLFVVSIIQIAQIVVSCVAINYGISYRAIFQILVGVSTPFIFYTIPFASFVKVFYYNEDERRRKVLNYVLMFVSIFLNVALVLYLFVFEVFGSSSVQREI